MPISSDLLVQSLRLEKWICEKALPLWSTRGINSDNGSVFERLDAQDNPDLSAAQRTRVQARQIFVFSAAQERGWIKDAMPLVLGIDNFIKQYAKASDDQPGYVHLLSNQGKVLDSKKDAYDYAFFILATIYKYRAFKDLNALHEVNNLLRFIESDFKHSSAGWSEGDYDAIYRRQNPHMHLFEAFLTCYEFTRDGKWLAKAGQIFSLFENVFFDQENGVLFEYFNQDWSTPDDEKAQVVEPGHMFEWVWLLRWYEELTGTPVNHYCHALFSKATDIGIDRSSGLIFDEVSGDGKPLTTTKRCWPLTEFIKASLAQAKANPMKRDQYEKHAADGITRLFNYYLHKKVTGYPQVNSLSSNSAQDYFSNTHFSSDVDELTGSYVDRLDSNNMVCDPTAPASTLYHIMMAAIVASDYANWRGAL